MTDDQRITLIAAALRGLNANAAIWTGCAASGQNGEEVSGLMAELAVQQVALIERRLDARRGRA